MRRSSAKAGHPGLLPGLRRWAVLCVAAGDWVTAEPLLREMDGIYHRCLGAGHPACIRHRRELVEVCVRMEDYERAEELCEAAIEAHLARPRASTAVLGRLLLALAHVHRLRGRPARAEAAFQRAWKTLARGLGRDHPLAARVANDLGTLYHELGWPTGARALYEHAAGVLRRSPRRRFVALGGCLNNLALLARESGAPEPAARLFGEHLELRRRALGDDDPGLTGALLRLAGARLEAGDADAAEELYRRAVAHAAATVGRGHPAWAEAAHRLARMLAGARRWSEAEVLARRARRVWHRSLGPRHPRLAEVGCDLAAICGATGRAREALEELARSAAVDDAWLRRAPLALLTRPWSPLPALRARLERSLELVSRYFSTDERAVGWALALTLRRKGIARALRSATAAGVACPLEAQIFRAWLTGPGTADLARHRRLLASWIRRRRRLAAGRPASPDSPKPSACPLRNGRLHRAFSGDGARPGAGP